MLAPHSTLSIFVDMYINAMSSCLGMYCHFKLLMTCHGFHNTVYTMDITMHMVFEISGCIHFSCCVVLCCVVLCCVVLCCVVLCCVVLCCVVLCRVVPCRVVSCRVVSCRVVSCRVVLCCVVSCRVVSCCVVLCCVVSCRVVLCCVAVCHQVPIFKKPQGRFALWRMEITYGWMSLHNDPFVVRPTNIGNTHRS